jgi:hypothetical protein
VFGIYVCLSIALVFCIYWVTFAVLFWRSGWQVRHNVHHTHSTTILPIETVQNKSNPDIKKITIIIGTNDTNNNNINTNSTNNTNNNTTILNRHSTVKPTPFQQASNDRRVKTADKISILAVGASICCLAQVNNSLYAYMRIYSVFY